MVHSIKEFISTTDLWSLLCEHQNEFFEILQVLANLFADCLDTFATEIQIPNILYQTHTH